MYQQSDIRKPITEESIREHRLQHAVEQSIRELVLSRRKSVPAELVKRLHEGGEARRVWLALSTGMVDRYDRSGAGAILSFAGLCFGRGRADILRAVVEAGQPNWMRELPRWEGLHQQFEAHGTMLPAGDAPQDWLRTLTCYQVVPTGPGGEASLFHIATEPITKHTAAFLDLALDVYPDHPDAAVLKDRNPEGAALLTQLQMERHLRSSASVVATSDTSPAVRAPLRRRATL